jgi:hypothetical protein
MHVIVYLLIYFHEVLLSGNFHEVLGQIIIFAFHLIFFSLLQMFFCGCIFVGSQLNVQSVDTDVE